MQLALSTLFPRESLVRHQSSLPDSRAEILVQRGKMYACIRPLQPFLAGSRLSLCNGDMKECALPIRRHDAEHGRVDIACNDGVSRTSTSSRTKNFSPRYNKRLKALDSPDSQHVCVQHAS